MKSKRKTITIPCTQCGMPKEVIKSLYDKRAAWGAKNVFCSNKCVKDYREKNYQWNI
jgi:hypothetical protein